MIDWIKKNWMFVLIYTACGFALFVGGRYSAPAKTVTVEKRVEVQRETQQIAQKLDLSEVMRAIKELQHNANIHRESTTEKRPDGTVVTHVVTDDKSTTTTHTDSSGTKSTHSELEFKVWRETIRTEEKIKLVESLHRPAWLLGVGAGVSIPGLVGSAPTSYLPGLPRILVVGASLEHQLVGPLYGGVGITSRGDVGLNLRVTF